MLNKYMYSIHEFSDWTEQILLFETYSIILFFFFYKSMLSGRNPVSLYFNSTSLYKSLTQKQIYKLTSVVGCWSAIYNILKHFSTERVIG